MKYKNLCSPLQTIRAHCLSCSDTAHEVELCPCEKQCKLWPYRFGTDPRREKRVLSDEQRAKLREQLTRGKTTAINGEKIQQSAMARQ